MALHEPSLMGIFSQCISVKAHVGLVLKNSPLRFLQHIYLACELNYCLKLVIENGVHLYINDFLL